jgi:hypothetical protein
VTGDLTHGPAPRAAFSDLRAESCGPGGRTPTGDQLIYRSPYLQRTTSESTMILWTSIDDDAPWVSVTTPHDLLLRD